MATTPNSVVLPQVPRIETQNFVQGTDSSGTLKAIFTPGANGSKVNSIMLTSRDDTVAHDVLLYLTRSGTDYLLGSVPVAIEAGHDGATPAANGFDATLLPGLPVDNDGQPYLLLEAGDVLKADFVTALTAGKRIDILTVGADF